VEAGEDLIGPPPSGKRYRINGNILSFVAKAE
jgi:hypothetical protein